MYFVYSGYISPDNCDGTRPTHTFKVFRTGDEVAAYKKEFMENINNECSNVLFEIVDGKQVFLEAKTVITEWKLK